MLKPIILAGGKGSRLWPLSRESRPKAFIKIPYLSPHTTLIQNTIKRIDCLNTLPPLIVCNVQHLNLASNQAKQISCDSEFLLEPIGKNTAPAIALSAIHATQNGDDPVLLVLPADHIIQDNNEFKLAIKRAYKLAKSDHIVTFGCIAKYASTEFGYIKYTNNEDTVSNTEFEIQEFVEKPNKELAREYINNGHYFWNSGIYVFKASKILKEFKKLQPELLRICKLSIEQCKTDGKSLSINTGLFNQCQSISFDHAIMEPLCQLKNINSPMVIPIDVGWSDIGTWRSLFSACLKKLINSSSFIKMKIF